MRPPTVKGSYDSLPGDTPARSEAAVDAFGQHLFSLRNQVLEGLRQYVESDVARARLPALSRREYDAVAALAPEGREAALGLSRRAVDSYIPGVLTLLTGTGDSLSLGPDHAINYRLVLEVKKVKTGAVAEEFTVNRNCRKALMDYFGRWLNRHGEHH